MSMFRLFMWDLRVVVSTSFGILYARYTWTCLGYGSFVVTVRLPLVALLCQHRRDDKKSPIRQSTLSPKMFKWLIRYWLTIDWKIHNEHQSHSVCIVELEEQLRTSRPCFVRELHRRCAAVASPTCLRPVYWLIDWLINLLIGWMTCLVFFCSSSASNREILAVWSSPIFNFDDMKTQTSDEIFCKISRCLKKTSNWARVQEKWSRHVYEISADHFFTKHAMQIYANCVDPNSKMRPKYQIWTKLCCKLGINVGGRVYWFSRIHECQFGMS